MPDKFKDDVVKTPHSTKRKIQGREIPQLLEAIRCGEPKDQKDALALLCPCRNPRYDIEIWRTIFNAQTSANSIEARDQAGHAIGTLRERARKDPRSQDLIRRLNEEGVGGAEIADAVPVWEPILRGEGLYIPRFEATSRSKANRRR